MLRLMSPDVWTALRGRSIFITGGTGFVGKWLLEGLLHAERELALGLHLTILTRNPSAFERASPHLAASPVVALLQGDVADFVFPARRYDYVIHAALPVAAPSTSADGGVLCNMAVAGAQHVCELAVATGAKQLLHVSSGAVYGPRTSADALGEESTWTTPEGINEYTRAKRESEALVRDHDWPFAVVVARCFAFLGPYLLSTSGSAAADFIERAARGDDIVIRGAGDVVRSYQYAGDMARWLLTCLVNGQAGRAYNIGSDAPVSIAELAKQTARIAEMGSHVNVMGGAAPGLAGKHYVPSVGRATEELGLTNAVGLDEGLRRTLRWRSNI
ncbi:NAD(P)-dependent oxidoreductase [soil metagenome]